MIKVSVAVITYNMEKYLPKLLESILMQKVNFEYEIVIDDDCSPDLSRDIIRKYQKKYPSVIRPIFRNHNVGGSRNMYGVLQACRGEYIAILEGDDFWEFDGKLQYQVDFLDGHKEYIGMTCNSWCDHGEIAEYQQLMRNRKQVCEFGLEDFKKRFFWDRLPTSTDTWMFRNIFLEDKNIPVFYEAHPMVWDQTLALILYGKGTICASPIVMSHHRSVVLEEGTNYQSVIRKKNCLLEESRMYECLECYMKQELTEECGEFYLARGDVWIEALFRAIKSKNITDINIAWQIWKEQKDKKMLQKLTVEKCLDIWKRKVRKILGGGNHLVVIDDLCCHETEMAI